MMKLKYLMRIWRTFRIPGLVALMRDWRSFIRMNYLFAALDSGLLEALKKPLSKQELGSQLDVKRPEIFEALLDVGLSLREIKIENGLYHISGKRSRALTGAQGDMLAALIQANLTYYSAAYRQAGHRIRGGPLGDDIKDIGALVARFSKIGEPLLGEFLNEMVAGSETFRILDVGCGSGVFLKRVSMANPQACGIGIELDPSVVEQARRNLAEWGLNQKFEVIGGDIRLHADSLSDRFDLVTLFNIIYYFAPDERLPLLTQIRSLLNPGGTLAIAMNFQSAGKDLAAANLNLVNCSLKGLTRLPALDGLKRLLSESGFINIRTQRLMPSSTFYGLTASVAETS